MLIFWTAVLLLQEIMSRRKKKVRWTISDVIKHTEEKTQAHLEWWSWVREGSADAAPTAGWWEGTRSRAWNRSHLSVGRTSHRIWVAFRALKSSGVSSSTVSPLPFTPSSRSFLYSFYRTEEYKRLQRRTHEQAGPKRRQKTEPSANTAVGSLSSKSPSLQTKKSSKTSQLLLDSKHFIHTRGKENMSDNSVLYLLVIKLTLSRLIEVPWRLLWLWQHE